MTPLMPRGFKPKIVKAVGIKDPEPEPPAVQLVSETPEDIKRQQAERRRRRGGRRKTLVTGELSPSVAGKKRLLG